VVRDHKWHDIEFEDLKNWAKKQKDRLNVGEEVVGKFFRYKFNKRRGKYQIRLRYRHSSAVYDPYH